MLKKIALGDLLIKKQVITEEQLNLAKQECKKSDVKLIKALVTLGYITENEILDFLSQQLNLPLFDLKQHEIDFKLAKRLSEPYARRYHALLLKEHKDGYLVGTSDPLDINAIDELQHVLKKPIYLVLVHEKELLIALNLIYRRTEEITSFAEELKEELSQEVKVADFSIEQGQVDAPVIKLLHSLFEDAVQVNASDIHIEPGEKVLRIRIRVDGVLYEQTMESAIANAVALRLKLMAGLDISERRMPQDGHFYIKIRDKILDVRLSTLPNLYGESTVMRLLDQSMGLLDLEQLGMPSNILKSINKLITMPNGILLVTGPTGSGKTTTLYAVLNKLNLAETKIITAEDPVEYRLPRINQVQVNEKLDLSFARILRSMLRQDPDIIMVGEMRDHTTADIAMRAALTGHLVLSTLHTNDSASCALRLLDMSVEGYLIAATLRGVLAQRLVRKICESCKKAYELTDVEKIWLRGASGEDEIINHKFYTGKGCSYCNNSGFKGRIGVYELLELDQAMIDALRVNDPSKFATLAAESLHGKLLLNEGLRLILDGVTTVSEVIGMAGEM